MAEYIEREELLRRIDMVTDTVGFPGHLAIKQLVSRVPAAEVAPMVHGRWIKIDNPVYFPLDGSSPYLYLCDQCHKKERSEKRFCSNCGAKMDLE